VEQAAAASESIVGQATHLATLVARYEVAGTVASAPQAKVPAHPVKPSPRPATERRSVERPWSKTPRAQAAAAAAKPDVEAPPARKSAAGNEDQEWQKF
jgi:hypothetical protein